MEDRIMECFYLCVHDRSLSISFHFPLGAESALEKAKKRDAYGKTYVSPWERAMKGNEDLLATMKTQMPGPYSYKELRKYKSFNRCCCISLYTLHNLPLSSCAFCNCTFQSCGLFFAFICYLLICLGVLCPMEALRRPLS